VDAPDIRARRHRGPDPNVKPVETQVYPNGAEDMSEEAEKARQALQESMDLRDQGHSDD
jgi:hypothetical protein